MGEQGIEAYRIKLEDIKAQTKRVELMLRTLENEEISSDRLNEVRDEFEAYLQDINNEYTKSAWESVWFKLNKSRNTRT